MIGFVATLTDITELRGVEESSGRRIGARTSSWRCWPTSSATRSRPSVNAAQVARRSPADEEARTWSAEVIERQVQQLGHLVDDLLDVSRISRGKIQLRKELIDARTVVERAVQVVGPQMAEKGHELSISDPRGAGWRSRPTRRGSSRS